MTENSNKKTAGYVGIRRFLLDKKILLNLLASVLAVYTLLLLIRITAAVFGNISVPNEYREVANIQLTKAFMDGINPYRMSAYDGDIPGIIYIYGPLYSLFTALLGKLIPIDIIALHYMVTLFSVVVSAGLAAYMVYKRTKYLAAPAAVFLFIINCSWRYGYINAVPDVFALMIFIIIIFLMSLRSSEEAEGNIKHLIPDLLCAVLSISLFFVKQYFLVIAAAVFLFKFINNRKDGIRFLFISAGLSAAIFIIVSVTCPLYWTYSVFFAHGPFGMPERQLKVASVGNPERYFYFKNGEKIRGIEKKDNTLDEESFTADSENTDPDSGFGYEILQLKSLAGMFIFIFAAALWGIITEIINGFKNRREFEFFLIILMVISFISLIYLGQNDGAWLSYYLQILMPEIIIYSFIFIDGMICADKRSINAAAFILLVLMMFFTAFRTDGRLKVYDKTKEQLADWSRAYALSGEYAERGEVLYVPLLGFQTIYNGQELYNNGHTTVITGRFLAEYEAVGWEQKIFPEAGPVLESHCDYQQKIKEKAADREYNLVTIIDGVDTNEGRLTVSDLESYGYRKIDSILLNTGRLSYDVEFWVP